ncbi:hypothetical protein [Psychrobacter fulvigenes]|uniref:hypothetical protein n=1 Tax=Psychrobacter fulvigenes TaxID=533323 RepID=UPI00191968B6|nr:hypothetical protein [Psychrobacter fulvigenes]
MSDDYSDDVGAGLKAQPTRYEHVLSVDELPKHDNSYEPRGVQYVDDAGFFIAQTGKVTPPPKQWYESKTIWFNAIVVAVSLATSATPALESFMSAEVYAVIASFVAFVNAVLRLVTGRPIKSGGA